MALNDYKFCEKGEVAVVPNGDSFSVLVDGKVACSISSGCAHRFPSLVQAEVFGNQLVRGYTGGTYLSKYVTDHITQ